MWRGRVVDGERQTVYVTLAGEALPKGGRAFKAATADTRYLKANGISPHGPKASSVDRPEELEPYRTRRHGCDAQDLAYWCVPECVEACYRDVGVRKLYKWQADCLSGPGVVAGRSVVYVAPTSAGKSLVSEVLVLRQLLFRGRRALIVLPYVSICAEKVASLRRLWGGCGVRVEALYSSSDGYWHAGADVGVCTIEKASSLLTRLLEDGALLRDIGVVVVDEMHLLGDEHRGYLLELILVKARLAAAAACAGGPECNALQVIGLSATLPNVGVLADWLGAHLHVSDQRPVPLSISIAKGGRLLAPLGVAASAPPPTAPPAPNRARDPDGIVPLVQEPMAAGHAVLVFCATKEWCEKAALMLAEELPPEAAEEVPPAGAAQPVASQGPTSASALAPTSRAEARLRLAEELAQSPAGLCPILARTLPRGVAYHHAGLTVEERAILEAGFRHGTLGCLCATSTLAAGVNLPCRRVIIRSLRVGMEELDATRFRQMAGRAGRAGLDSAGECVLITRSDRDASQAKALVAAELAPLRSALRGHRLARGVLEAVSLGLVRTVGALETTFLQSLLRYHEEAHATSAPDWPGSSQGSSGGPRRTLREDLQASLHYLQEQHLVRVDVPAAAPAVGDPAVRSLGAAAAGGSPPAAAGAGSTPGRDVPSQLTQSAAPAGSSGGLIAAGGSASEACARPGGPQQPAAAPGPSPGCAWPCPEATLLATPLGDGVVHSSLKPDEALAVFEDLRRAREGIRLDTDLHLVFLATPATGGPEPDWQRYLTTYERMQVRERAVADAVGVQHKFLLHQALGRCAAPSASPGGASTAAAAAQRRLEKERLEAIHRRFWVALALKDLVAEVPATAVASAYGIPRGSLQSVQSLASVYCGMVRQLCHRLRWFDMAALFEALEPRLSFGAPPEALPLCQIPGVHARRARALLRAGLDSPQAVARAPLAAVEAALRRTQQYESNQVDGEAARRQEAVVRQAALKIWKGAQERVSEHMQQLEDEAEEEQSRVRRAVVAAAV